ncbi:MAG TPA: NAD(P)/FAD-dependent oxidoreductase, partial [Acidiferrobacteraceae bacterium]|nr:NAD(P)/FAD-dependent oxidoreductase [Acidiferrobacteraceae bacterium]
AGATLQLHTHLVALDPAAREATLVQHGEQQRVRYRLLIGADGPRSQVARLMGLPALACVQTRQYTVPLMAAYAATDIWLSDEFAGGYGWLFPKGTVAHVGIGTDRSFQPNLKQPLERLHQQLVAEGRVGLEILARTGGDIPVSGLRASLVEDAVLFVGDAAGLTHPITGAGISAAVVSGTCAGHAVVESLRSGRADALASFEEDMRDQFEDTLRRAVGRRQRLARAWHTQAAADDGVMRRGWIAFPEYFSEHRLVSEPASVFSGATL